MEPPTTLDWGSRGGGKHESAQAGTPGAKAATNWAKLQEVGCQWPWTAGKGWRCTPRVG